MDSYSPIHFIEEPISVFYDEKPIYEKKPTCPNAFVWRGKRFTVVHLISEWRDYSRIGRMSRNMQPQHAAVASIRGSRGVGKFYFRISVEENRIFDIYFDRAPKNVDQQKGTWFLYQELSPSSG
jgi:hypothetical protein